MIKLLILIDFQNDFINGSLGTPEAQAIVPKVSEKLKNWDDGPVIVTMDTHDSRYLETTLEGEKLPIPHCIWDTKGWENPEEIDTLLDDIANASVVKYYRKETFGSIELATDIKSLNSFENISEIHICGLCTDICVISNALLLKAALPNIPIICDASCCAGTTPENHQKALDIMKCCQIDIINS